MLETRGIEALAMVCQEGGFERAARVLLVTQSAISQRVRQLEDQLGVPLVVRANPPRPTAVGAKLIAHYRKVAQLERDLQDDLALSGGGEFLSLPIGVNEDSMSTWFIGGISRLARDRNFTLHISVDDQDETYKLLKMGEVLGCVSTRTEPMQGCSVAYLGRTDYYCLAAASFLKRWLPDGLDEVSVRRAPAVLYSTKDRTHDRYLEQVLGLPGGLYPHHFIPSPRGFLDAIATGLGYGLVPHFQARELMETSGVRVVEPRIPMPVHLFWHHWDLEAGPIRELTRALVRHARKTLPQGKEPHEF